MNDQTFADLCRRQYLAAFRMLRNAIEACPEGLWDQRDGTEAPFWQQALHAIFYADLYVQPDFPPATGIALDAMAAVGLPGGDIGQTMGGLTGRDFHPPRTPTKLEMLDMLNRAESACNTMARQVAEDGADVPNPMPWMKGSTRADLLLYNLRHIQHHIGRLHSILGRKSSARLDWIGGMP